MVLLLYYPKMSIFLGWLHFYLSWYGTSRMTMLSLRHHGYAQSFSRTSVQEACPP